MYPKADRWPTDAVSRCDWQPDPESLSALVMCFTHQLAERRHIAKTIFNSVIIDCVISVVVSVWAPRFVTALYSVPIVVPWR
jgi:hypothetical protein